MKSKILLSSLALALFISCHKIEVETPPLQLTATSPKVPMCEVLTDEPMTLKAMARKLPVSAASTLESIIWINFEGSLVQGTAWNTTFQQQDIVCAPANLMDQQKQDILKRVTEDYAPYQVRVTLSKEDYLAADPYKRTEVIVTPSSQWYGSTVGGISYVNSFIWGNNTPCFVFSELLYNNVKYIGEAVSHETGHTLGLLHDALFDKSGTLITSYNPGSGESSGNLSWAPIMGNSYFNDLTTFSIGKTPSNASQDCFAIITQTLPYKPDDCPATFTGAVALSSSVNGLLEVPNDEDLYALSGPTVTFDVTSSGNIDIRVEVYDRARKLLRVVDDPLSKDIPVTTINSKGKTIFLKIMASATSPNTPQNFMNGQYKLSLH